MKMLKVFIDGREGTTGLQIEERLRAMPGVTLLEPDPLLRKDAAERQRLIHSADAVFLCLPDAAARESAALAEGSKAVIFDASTAHRTHPDWVYGFPELSPELGEAVKTSNRIAVPGCHATGFCAIVYPLVWYGLVSAYNALSCFSLTGYSGGGKAMIAEYEGENAPTDTRPYALTLAHKHLPEMQKVCGLYTPPVFMPAVVPVRQGMLVSVPLGAPDAPAKPLHACLEDWYAYAKHVRVMPFGGADALEAGRLPMQALNGTDDLEIFVFGHETQALVIARFDNLGKGAAGAAVQCLKLRFGL
ncbi:MAG: N-acetyl-gamma-glutamyl-phosphate reductase [Oscillospiraceae bacterium]|jgi:N-acetyl-gamma-glutamyl-phosphate reductase|nr:N-acetyl-gamma-glutamyl-phosphate reductase [Oscillospiraceae bacterium]